MPVAPSSDSDKNSRPVGSAATTKKSDAVIKEYSKIKNFRFDIGGKWDDKNVCIFLPCFRETIKECSDYGKKNIDFWAKIAERGIASGGSRECFSSANYCMELAERLKEFVQKYEKELQGVEVFDELKKDVSDLLPYFPPPEYDVIEKIKSRSVKAVNNSAPASELEGVELILKVCNRHLHRFGRAGLTYVSVFGSISKEVTEISGVKTDVKSILEKLKQGVIKTLNAEPNPVERARMFPEITKNFSVFDYVEPRDIKKKDYVPVETSSPVLNELVQPAKGNISSMIVKRDLKAIEPPASSPGQLEAMEVRDVEAESSSPSEVVNGKPETEEEFSEPSSSASRVDEGESLETSTDAQPVAQVPRRRGRPPKKFAKKVVPVRDASPIMTRSLQRRKESGSETESNVNVSSGISRHKMIPFVSMVRMPLLSSSDLSKRNRIRKNGAQGDTVLRRRRRPAGEFIRPISNGFRSNTADRARRSFSPDNLSDGSGGSARKKPRSGKMSSDLFRPIFSRQELTSIQTVEEQVAVPAHTPRSYHPSTYSARANELPTSYLESNIPGRSIVQRGRPRAAVYTGGRETNLYGGDMEAYPGPSAFCRDLISRYEEIEKKKLAAIQKMHSDLVQQMSRNNDLLELMLRGSK